MSLWDQPLDTDDDLELQSTRPVPSNYNDLRVRGVDNSVVNPIMRTRAATHDDDDKGKNQPEPSQAFTLNKTLESRTGVRCLLYFSGIIPPRSWISPWMICRVCWPISVAVGVVAAIGFAIDAAEGYFAGELFAVVIPAILGQVTALGCFWWLPRLTKRLLMNNKVSLPPEERPMRLSVAYIAVCGVAGIVQWIYDMVNRTYFHDSVFGETPVPAVNWTLRFSTIPVLGAVLLVLGLDTTWAIAEIRKLQEAARNQTLTRGMYTTVRDHVCESSMAWSVALGVLSLVAFYNTVGLIVVLHNPQIDPFYSSVNFYYMTFDHCVSNPQIRVKSSTIPYVPLLADLPVCYVHTTAAMATSSLLFSFSFLFFFLLSATSSCSLSNPHTHPLLSLHLQNLLGKEALLLMMIASYAVDVNDQADAIAALLSEPWGEVGSKEEIIRLDLLALATTKAITPAGASSLWSYLHTPYVQPISFRVCGFRIMRAKFMAGVVTLVLSMLTSFVKHYLKAWVIRGQGQ